MNAIKEDVTLEEMQKAVKLLKEATDIFKEDDSKELSSDEVSHLALYFRFIIDVAEGNISETDITQLMSMNDVTTNQQLH